MRETLQRAKVRGFSPELIFDIGASSGIWTRECRSIYREARYVLADPLEANRDALLAMASADKRITVWCGATGAQTGQLELYEHGDQSSVLYSEDFPGAQRTVSRGHDRRLLMGIPEMPCSSLIESRRAGL
jgi:FkbM family methyltransferase